ncbi:MAG TPA: VTT domain-containing protein [Anaerolineaceae bacterium]|jgi:membrane protein YqaA with SNARE-associated domain|nr:VTT domain-containing protein [Anaerolineaceae bacterium]
MTQASQPGKTGFTRTQVLWRVLLLLVLIAVTALIIIFRTQVQKLQAFGYPGIFLFSVLSNATILFPLPGVVFTSAMGTVFHPAWVALAAGLGAAVGELSGYLAGVSGQLLVENKDNYQKVLGWMRKYGLWTILVLAFIPNPLFDIAGFIAGSLKVPAWKFLLFCAVGKIAKMLLFAYLGAGLFSLFA